MERADLPDFAAVFFVKRSFKSPNWRLELRRAPPCFVSLGAPPRMQLCVSQPASLVARRLAGQILAAIKGIARRED